MAPSFWFSGGGGNGDAAGNFDGNTHQNHRGGERNNHHQSERASLLSAQGYVKDERDDPQFSQKARKGREKVAEQLLRDAQMRGGSGSGGERKSSRRHHRDRHEAAELGRGGNGGSLFPPRINSYGTSNNNEYQQYQHGTNTSSLAPTTSYSRLLGGCLIAGSVAMVCTASSDSVIGHLLLSPNNNANDDIDINASNNRGGVASSSKRKSPSSYRGGGEGGGRGQAGISGWSSEYATNFLGGVTKNEDNIEDDKLLEGDLSNDAIALANGKTLLEKFDADAFEKDLASTSGDFEDEEKRDVQLSDDDLLTTCEAWRVQIKNDATMFQARLLKLSAILDATSDDSSRLPHDDVVNSIKSVRKWHTTTDVDATAKVKELTRRAKMEKAGDGNKSVRRKKLEAEAIKVEELASTSLPKLENALNEIEEKFIPSSAQSEPVRQRAELGAAPTQSSWLSSLFGGAKAPMKMAQLGAATNSKDNAELGAGYGGDPWGAHGKFDDELEMEEERDVKDERRKNVASLHERQRIQKQKEEFGLVDDKADELPVRATSFAKGLSNRRSRRVGPFYDSMGNSEEQRQQQQQQTMPASITPLTSDGRISEADIERRAQELVDEAHGGIDEEEERVNEGEEVFDDFDDGFADEGVEVPVEDEQFVQEEEVTKPSRAKKPRGLSDRISDTVRRAFGYADPGEEFLEEASEEIQEEEEEQIEQKAQRQQQKVLRNGKRNGSINSKKKGSSSSLSGVGAATTTSKERKQQEKRGSATTTVSINSGERMKKGTNSESASTKPYSKFNDINGDDDEPVDTFSARMKAAKKLKEAKESGSATKSWNSAGEEHQMKFKPGQKLIVQEDGSFAFADEDDINSKDSDTGLQKRNEETSKVLRSLSEDQDSLSSSSSSSSNVNEKEVQSPPPAISPPPPSPSPPPPNAPVAQPAVVQPAAIDPTQTAQMLYQQNIAAMNNQMMMNAAASNNNNANANANMGSSFKLTSENLDAVAMAKLEHDTANRNALELYDISNQNRDAAELARSEHETAMHWRQEAQKNLERLEATAAKKAISEENAAQQQEKLQNLNALVSEFKKALVEETALRRKADIEKENLAREYEQKKIEIATKASEAQGRLIEHAKDKILEARRTAALATQQANEYLEQAKREAIARRRIGEFAKRSNSKMNEDKKALAKRLQAEKDEISEAAKEVQRSAEEALMRLNSANSQAQKERDLALSDRQQALEEAKRAVDTAKMSLDGMKEMSKKAQKYKRRQEETVDSVKEYIKNDGEGKFDKLDKLLRKAEDEDLSSSHPGGKKSKASSSSTKKKKTNSDKGSKDIDGMSDEDAAAEKVKKLLGGGGEEAAADASADSDDAVAEGSGEEDDAILEPMTDDVDSILANAEKNGVLAGSTSEVSTAEDVRSSVENSGSITEAEAEKNLAAYFGETTPSPTPASSASDGGDKEEESDEKKSDDASEETSTEENVEAADKGEKEEEEKKRDEANTETRQNAVDDDDDNASDPSSLITLDDQEVSNIPTSGVVASLGFPSITRIAFGEPEQKAFKEVFFAYLQEQAPDSCASADDMETYVQERTKKTGTKAEHLRVTLVCSSASSEADTLKAQQVVRDGVSDGSLLKKLAASGIKSRVFIDKYEDKNEAKDEGEDADDTTTTEEDEEKERGVKQDENDEQQ
jgi:hypothetical protein